MRRRRGVADGRGGENLYTSETSALERSDLIIASLCTFAVRSNSFVATTSSSLFALCCLSPRRLSLRSPQSRLLYSHSPTASH